MKIARRKSTQAYINDFQKNATIEGLTKNALAMGVPADDVEVIDVTEAEFDAIVEQETAAAKAEAEQQQALSREQMLAVLNGARTAWGFTKPQMKLFLRAMKQLNEEDII